MVNEKTEQVRIGYRVSEGTKAKIQNVAELDSISCGEALDKIVDQYKAGKTIEIIKDETALYQFFGFTSPEEFDLVKKAIDVDGLDFKTFAAMAILRVSKTIVTQSEKDFDKLTPEELNKTTTRGAVEYKVMPVIEKLMEYNNSQSEKVNKYCITTSLLVKLTGCNYNSIKKIVDQRYKIMIDDHNHKHGLTDSDNRKGKGNSINLKKVLGLKVNDK